MLDPKAVIPRSREHQLFPLQKGNVKISIPFYHPNNSFESMNSFDISDQVSRQTMLWL